MTWNEIKTLARELRKSQTKEEAILWGLLRNRKFKGYKFLRQHPIIYTEMNRNLFFIADFYCHEMALVLEVDGKIHDHQKDYDIQRDLIIQQKGLRVLRIRNEEVNESINDVLSKIEKVISNHSDTD